MCFLRVLQVNITHAALDVILRALRDYREITATTTATKINQGSGGGSRGDGSTGDRMGDDGKNAAFAGVSSMGSAPDARDCGGGVEGAAAAQQQQR